MILKIPNDDIFVATTVKRFRFARRSLFRETSIASITALRLVLFPPLGPDSS